MPRGGMNDCVLEPLDDARVDAFQGELLRLRTGSDKTVEGLCEEFGMSPPAFYNRLRDPDRFTLGQLRRLREVLGARKADVIHLIRPLL